MNKPREFTFVCITTQRSSVLKTRVMGSIWTDEIGLDEKEIQLIEKSAYDELQAKAEKLVEALRDIEKECETNCADNCSSNPYRISIKAITKYQGDKLK